MENILTIEHLHAYYTQYNRGMWDRNRKMEILHDITLNVEEGEIVGIVGESGCGKTTLAKSILGIHRDIQGEITLKDDCNVQMVFQDPYSSLNPAKTIEWIMEEPLRLNTKLSKQERRAEVTKMLSRVGLDEEIAKRYPSQLSGGQRQRVCIGTALMLKPRLLIADEPVSALDVTIQAQVIELMLKLQKEMGMSILFISHDLRVVYKICKKIVILQQGRVMESGLIDDIYNTPQSEYTKQLLDAAGVSL